MKCPVDQPRLPADIARIALPTPFPIGDVNAYLLKGEPLALLDPGPRTDEAWRELQLGLKEQGTLIEDIELIVLTHQHEDHIGLAHAVAERSGAPIMGVAELASMLRDWDSAMDTEERYIRVMMLRHGVDDESAAALMRMFKGFRRYVESAEVGQLIDEGSRIVAGGRELTVLRAPGHSPTDTLFLSESDGVMFGGDHLLERISSNPVAHWPIGRDPETSAAAPDRRRALIEYLTSIGRTSEFNISLVLPGHGEPFTGHREIIKRRIAMHRARAQTILGTMNGPVTAAELGRLLWEEAPRSESYLVLSEVLGHLDLLEQAGQVRELPGDGPMVRWQAQ